MPAGTSLTLELLAGGGAAPVMLALDSYSFGAHNPVSIGSGTGGGGSGASRPSFDGLRVDAAFGADAPLLLRALTTGSHFQTGVLTQKNAADQPVAAWVMENVFVTGDRIAGDSAAAPTESLSFVFEAVTEATSAHQASWDLATARADGPPLPAGLELAPLPAPPADAALTLELQPGGGAAPVTLALDSYSFGAHNTVTIGSGTGGGGAGRASFDELQVTAAFGAESPLLLSALTSGRFYATGLLTQRNAAGQPVAVWVLDTVAVTGDGVSGGTGLPAQSLSFVFEAVTEATSAHQASWDLTTARADGPPLPAGLTLAALPAPASPALTLELQPGGGAAPVTLALDSYSFGAHNTVTIGSGTGGGGAGRASFDELQVTAAFGAESPLLLSALTSGRFYATGLLTQRNAAGQPVAVWVLDTVAVTGDGVSGGTGLPAQGLSFVFEAVTEATSAYQASWDLATARADGPPLPAGLVLAPLPAPADAALTLELQPGGGAAPVTLALDSYSFGAQNTVTIGSGTGGGGPGAGRPSFDGLQVTAAFSAESPLLLSALTSGRFYATALLTQRNAAGQPVAVWVLDTVAVTGDTIAGDSAAAPTESLSFVFEAVTEATSAYQTSWDLTTTRADGPPLPAGLTLAALPAPASPALTLELQPGGGAAPVTLALDSYSFGAHNTVTIGSGTGGGGAGRASFDELQVTAAFGAESPLLLSALTSGRFYATALLTQRNAAGQPVAVWVLDTVAVTGDSVSGGTGLPAQSLSFVFEAVTEATSAYQASWDLTTARADGPPLPAGLTLAPLPTPADATLTLELQPGGGAAPVTLALASYGFGFFNTVSIGGGTGGGGTGTGRPLFDGLQVTSAFAAESPLLLSALTSGRFYATGLLTQRNAAGQPVAVWVMDTVAVTGDSVSGGTGLPAQSLSFVFGAVTEATSAHQTSWDVTTARADGPPLPAGLVLFPLSNVAPTDLTLSPGSVPENQPAGTLVGLLSTTDANLGDTFTYTFAPGGADNAAFVIDGDQLKTNASFDFESKSSYTIRVRSTDNCELFVEKDLTISITDVNDAPSIAVPGAQTAFEDVDLSLSGVSVADVDTPSLTVTLQVSHGTLNLATTTGLRVDNNGTAAVTLFGSPADLNAALASLSYRGRLNFSGSDLLSITVSDGGSNTSDGVAIHVKSGAEQAADLRDRVNALRNTGVLRGWQALALNAWLDLSGRPLDVVRVSGFLLTVRAYRLAGILTAAQADALLGQGQILLLSVTRR